MTGKLMLAVGVRLKGFSIEQLGYPKTWQLAFLRKGRLEIQGRNFNALLTWPQKSHTNTTAMFY